LHALCHAGLSFDGLTPLRVCEHSYAPLHFLVAVMLMLGTAAGRLPRPPSERYGVESRGRLPISEVRALILFLLYTLRFDNVKHGNSAEPVTDRV